MSKQRPRLSRSMKISKESKVHEGFDCNYGKDPHNGRHFDTKGKFKKSS